MQRLKQSWILLINCALEIIDSFAQVLENVIYNEINWNYFCYKFYKVHKEKEKKKS